MSETESARWVRAAARTDLDLEGCRVVHLNGHTLALFAHNGVVHAVDNRCPHMGFPLSRGTVGDCILTCHWHHARFDLRSGGTFDPWADDVRAFPVEIRGDEIWVDLAPRRDPLEHQRERLREGLEREIPLVLAKAAIALTEGGVDPAQPFREGLEFGVHHRRGGWGQGLTIHACMMNLIPHLDPEERPRAVYHGLSAVARDSAGMAPRFGLRPLPGGSASPESLERWLRRFVEVRDAEGAERCIVTAVRAGADAASVAAMLFAAATDHRYIQTGHVLDFINKAMEALDWAGWDAAESALSSLATGLAHAERMEESSAWRHPVDLVDILERAFEQLPAALATGSRRRDRAEAESRRGAARESLVEVLLGDDPRAIAEGLLAELREGCTPAELAGIVAGAAALRIARFHTSNEFGDWDRALHTFTFANAVHQGLRRTDSPALVRGVFDAAMSVYLDRFLNIPAAALPEPAADADPEWLLRELPLILDRQQQVNEAGALAASFLDSGGDPARLRAALGAMLLREDRDFHTIQAVEAAFRQQGLAGDSASGRVALIAAARYLAGHAPTVRAQAQTFQIARRLHRGDHLFEGD